MTIRTMKWYKYLLFIVIGLPFWVHGAIDWQMVTEEIYANPAAYALKPIGGGASNRNYHLCLEGSHYFIRIAPKSTALLDADIEVEYQVLQSLCGLNISPEPIYFNKDKRILIMEFIQEEEEIDLLDPEVRGKVMSLLHQIENLDINIDREYCPFRDILTLVETVDALGEILPEGFNQELLPALKKIDSLLSKIKHKKLCHFDLHHKNILKSNGRFFIVDWEYATMSDPFLTLGSMASIERWSDRQMDELVQDYSKSRNYEDFYRLYLYRIVADIHWVVWNHVQSKLSTIDLPYRTWERLFFESALERVRSALYVKAITHFETRK